MQQAVSSARLLNEELNMQRLLQALHDITGQQAMEIFAEYRGGGRMNFKWPWFQQLLRECLQGDIQRVLVFTLTPLSSTALEAMQVLAELDQLGIIVCSCIVDFGPFGGVEQPGHRWRIRNGRAEALWQGKRIGRPVGSTENPAAFLRKHAPVVRHLRQGLSVRKTAKLCEVAPKTVSKVKALLPG
jgi:DNA invertase Pin-like site-specific DNA recombinase